MQEPTPEVRDEAIKIAVEEFTTAFKSYANPQRSSRGTTSHLKEVMQAMADLGAWLFAQPCGFEFVWDGTKDGRCVIFPAMVKISDELGDRLTVKQVLIEAELSNLR